MLEDLLSAGEGLDIIERAVPDEAVGRPPDAGPGRLVMAVVRDGEVLRFDDDRAQTTQDGRPARLSLRPGRPRLRADD